MGRNLSLRERRFRARGLSPRNARRWVNARFLGAAIGNRATITLGTGNSAYQVWAKRPGTGGNSITFEVVVAGATFNSATSAGSVATSTVNDMISAISYFPAATALVHVQRAPVSSGAGVVAAVAATALAGAV